MPNHVHVVVRPFEGNELSHILHSWKSFTSNQIEHEAEKLWQAESFDRIIRDEDHFRSCVRYVLRNPEKARLNPYDCQSGSNVLELENVG